MPNYFSAFNGHQYMNLVTYRKSGEGVTTPVWFAQKDDCLVLMTLSSAAKIKRIRNNPRVQVSPSDARGNALGSMMDGCARVLKGKEAKEAEQMLSSKYGLLYAALRIQHKLSGKASTRMFIEISASQSGRR